MDMQDLEESRKSKGKDPLHQISRIFKPSSKSYKLRERQFVPYFRDVQDIEENRKNKLKYHISWIFKTLK